MDKDIFDVITEYAVNEGLSHVLQHDEEYKQIICKIDDLTEKLDALGLSEEQRLLMDRLISAYNENGAYYGRLTYQQGFRDCTLLLVEIGLIKDEKGRLGISNSMMGLTGDEILQYWKYISIGIEIGRKQSTEGYTQKKHYEMKKFIVPIKKRSFDNEEIVREVIIRARNAEVARLIAIGDFQHDSDWTVDMNYLNYRQL